MKQKQVKTPAKAVKQPKAGKTSVHPKKLVKQCVSEEEEEEEVFQKQVTKTQTIKRKVPKGKKVIEEPEPVVEEQEDEDEELEDDSNDDDENEEENDVEEGDEEEEEEDDEEEADENEEQDDDENDEEVDENDEEDDESSEESAAPPSKVLTGPVRPTYKIEQCIHVTKLPAKCKQINIVEAFAKYGPIQQIHIVTTPSVTFAQIAFKKVKSAKAALADDKEVKVGDNVVQVSELRERNSATPKEQGTKTTVFVSNLPVSTTEEQMKELFKHCGEITLVKVLGKNQHISKVVLIRFAEETSIPAALKLHNIVFGDRNIKVVLDGDSRVKTYDEKFTIKLHNKQELGSIDISKLEAIFSKCGEIENVDVLCKKILAFITFKTEKAVEKALQMSGETKDGIVLDIEPYSPFRNFTAIHVNNIPKNCTEDDLKALFSKAGEIKSINLKPTYANIFFENSDGYCKSFLFNESKIKGRTIFIEPLSMRNKGIAMKKSHKRPFQNGKSAFVHKKQKKN